MLKQFLSPAWSGTLGGQAPRRASGATSREARQSSNADSSGVVFRVLRSACVAGSLLFAALFALLIYAVARGDADILALLSSWLPSVGLPLLAGLAVLGIMADPAP